MSPAALAAEGSTSQFLCLRCLGGAIREMEIFLDISRSGQKVSRSSETLPSTEDFPGARRALLSHENFPEMSLKIMRT